MRTTVILEDDLFEQVQRVSGARSKTEAVSTALREYLRLKAREELLSMQGRLDVDATWSELREAELHE